MATIKTISAALKLVDTKKENLRKAFEDLQSHSSSLSNFNLTWSDLDSYFTSLQSSLQQKFTLLLTQQQSIQPPNPQTLTQQQPIQPPNPQTLTQPQPQPQPQTQPSPSSVPARPELKTFCERLDSLGLRNYVSDRPTERDEIKAELPDAFRSSPDPAALVLDAMGGFCVANSKGRKDIRLSSVRRSCVLLLEGLLAANVVEIKGEVKEKAKKTAVDWKRKVGADGDPLGALGFLHLLAAYGLGDRFNKEELIDIVVVGAKFQQAIQSCRLIGFGDKISDIILKLISKGKQHLAVKFIFEFELTDKFPPVPLLKEYLKSKKHDQKACQGGKNSLESLADATIKEIGALKSVIKIIEDYKLESEYPKEKLMKRIEVIEKKKADMKGCSEAPASETQQQSVPQKQSGSKRPRTTAPDGPAATLNSITAARSTVLAYQQSHIQPAGLLPEHHAPYWSSPAGPYDLVGSTPVAPHAGSSTGLYGLAGGPLGTPGISMPTWPQVYPPESHMTSGYIDRPIAYGGYGLPPQYHPPYYPQ